MNSFEPLILINHSGFDDTGPQLYTVPLKYTPLCDIDVPLKCTQYTLLLSNIQPTPVSELFGVECEVADALIKWLEDGCQGLGVQQVMEITDSGLHFTSTRNVVMVLHVATSNKDFSSQ